MWFLLGWVLAGGCGAVGDVEGLGLFGGDEPDLDQVERADEAVADPEAASGSDRVAQRDRPPQGGGQLARRPRSPTLIQNRRP